MNSVELEFAHLVPENNTKFAVNGITICIDCGSVETTILTFGMYCRICQSFRLFKPMLRKKYQPTGTVLDLD